jgi:hypothetical protein
MANIKPGPRRMYLVEDIVNAASIALSNIGFDAGEQADREQYENGLGQDMSGLADRLLDVRGAVEEAISMVREYEQMRREVTA